MRIIRIKYCVLFTFILPFTLAAQQAITLDEALTLGLQNSPRIQASGLEIERQQALKRVAGEIPKTDIMLLYGQYNSHVKNDNNITIAQSIPFPSYFARQQALGKAYIKAGEMQKDLTSNEVAFQIKQAFYQLLFLKAQHALLLRQDSLLQEFVRSASLRYSTGEGTLLEKTSAETQQSETRNAVRQNEGNYQIVLHQLKTLINQQQVTDVAGLFHERSLPVLDTALLAQNPQLQYIQQQLVIADHQQKAEVAKSLPDIKIGYFNQTLIGYQNVNGTDQYFGKDSRFQGFEVGLSIPLWFTPHIAKSQAAKIQRQISERNVRQTELSLHGQFAQTTEALLKIKNSLDYYNKTALPNASLLAKQNILAFRSGETTYTAYLINLKSVIAIQEGFLQTQNEYNQTVIYLEYLTGTLQ